MPKRPAGPVDPKAEELEAARLEEAVKRKRRAIRALRRLEEEEQGEGDEPEPTDPALPGLSKAQEILDELKGQGTFEVFRLTEGRQVKHGTYDVDMWPAALESTVRQKGGGDYVIVFRNPDGSRAGGFTRTFDEASYKPAMAPAAPAAGTSPDLMRFMEIMAQAEARHSAQLEAMRLESQRAQAEDRKTLLELIKAQTSGGPLKDMGALLSFVKALQGERQDPLDRILELREVMDTLRGDAQREDAEASPLVSLVNRVADALTGLSHLAPKPPAGPVSNGHSAKPAPVPPRPLAAPPVRPEILDYCPSILAAINAGVGADAAAENVVRLIKVPEDRTRLVGLLSEDWTPLYEDTELKAHRPWVDAFRSRLEDLLTAPEAPAAQPVPEGSPAA